MVWHLTAGLLAQTIALIHRLTQITTMLPIARLIQEDGQEYSTLAHLAQTLDSTTKLLKHKHAETRLDQHQVMDTLPSTLWQPMLLVKWCVWHGHPRTTLLTHAQTRTFLTQACKSSSVVQTQLLILL